MRHQLPLEVIQVGVLLAARQGTRGFDRDRLVVDFLGLSPLTDGVEVFQPEPDRVELRMARSTLRLTLMQDDRIAD